MLDFDLAILYETETRILKQAVRRNMYRFPDDFMFELTKEEYNSLTSQIVILKNKGRGQHIKYLPFAFTEQGVAMLSSVLNSKKAIRVNIIIIRAFVLFRQHLSDYNNLQIQIKKIEKEMSVKFNDIHQALNYLLKKNNQENQQKHRKKIGY
jgi:ORF6N domain-containing protein